MIHNRFVQHLALLLAVWLIIGAVGALIYPRVVEAYTRRLVTYRDCLTYGQKSELQRQGQIIIQVTDVPVFAEPVETLPPDGRCSNTTYYYSGFDLVPPGEDPPVVLIQYEPLQTPSAAFYESYGQTFNPSFAAWLQEHYGWSGRWRIR